MSNMTYGIKRTPISWSLTGAINESHPTFALNTFYAKNTKVIYGNKIYTADTNILRRADYVYDDEKQTLKTLENIYLDSTAVAIKTNETVFIEKNDLDILYKYTGANATLNFNTLDFATNSSFESQGKQLNGYLAFDVLPTNQLYWTDNGYVNTLRWDDEESFNKTIAQNPATDVLSSKIIFTFTVSYTDTITVLGLEASKITIKTVMQDGNPENPENTQIDVYDLFGVEGTTLSEWIYNPIKVIKSIQKPVPLIGIRIITIIIEQSSINEYAKVGDIYFTKSKELGEVKNDLSQNIIDYSTYETDAEGNDIITKKGYKRELPFSILYKTINNQEVSEAFIDLRGTPTIFNLYPESHKELYIIKGFLKVSSNQIQEVAEYSTASLTITSALEK